MGAASIFYFFALFCRNNQHILYRLLHRPLLYRLRQRRRRRPEAAPEASFFSWNSPQYILRDGIPCRGEKRLTFFQEASWPPKRQSGLTPQCHLHQLWTEDQEIDIIFIETHKQLGDALMKTLTPTKHCVF